MRPAALAPLAAAVLALASPGVASAASVPSAGELVGLDYSFTAARPLNRSELIRSIVVSGGWALVRYSAVTSKGRPPRHALFLRRTRQHVRGSGGSHLWSPGTPPGRVKSALKAAHVPPGALFTANVSYDVTGSYTEQYTAFDARSDTHVDFQMHYVWRDIPLLPHVFKGNNGVELVPETQYDGRSTGASGTYSVAYTPSGSPPTCARSGSLTPPQDVPALVVRWQARGSFRLDEAGAGGFTTPELEYDAGSSDCPPRPWDQVASSRQGASSHGFLGGWNRSLKVPPSTVTLPITTENGGRSFEGDDYTMHAVPNCGEQPGQGSATCSFTWDGHVRIVPLS
jgi:hypothetical protein